MTSSILQANHPFKYSSRNPRTHYKRIKAGEIFLVEVEIDEEVWNQIRTLPENALIENISWFHDGDNTEPEPILGTTESPDSKGPYGSFWRGLFRKGFQNQHDLTEHLACDPKQVREALHKLFEVDTLSIVPPAKFEAWIEQAGLPASLITMSRAATLEAAEQG